MVKRPPICRSVNALPRISEIRDKCEVNLAMNELSEEVIKRINLIEVGWFASL